ncbi:uncharacterized protein LOC119096914 [Pollicipes pollicipes]|uniref:uncharacterized protein LOC119096914 n=1 Tax=Pollicipes pollicipes TaxID=41117 RepID=UPI001884980C|nr:uncharacterized protein LOC119096914 [Pollicipes pollicipes]
MTSQRSLKGKNPDRCGSFVTRWRWKTVARATSPGDVMKLLLLITLSAVAAAAETLGDEADPRFAFINVEDNGLRFEVNNTSIAYGVVTVVIVAVLLLILIPLLSSFGGGGEETGYGSTGYDTGYSSYKRSLDSAMPILHHLQEAWEKFQ